MKKIKEFPKLTEEQENEVLSLEFLAFTEENIRFLLDKWNITWHGFKRRARKSKLKIKFAYSWTEFQSNSKLKSIFNKNNLLFKCKCGIEYVCVISGFVKRRYQIPICNMCYRKEYHYDSDWRSKNSAAQFIAQNRSEVLEKQRNAQLKRHTRPGMKARYIEIGKNLWKNEKYRAAVIKNSSISMAGKYKHYIYQSSLELAFIFWCERTNRKIENYNGNGIEYFWNEKKHKYFPDFIINSDTFVEVKGSGSIYNKTKIICDVKNTALKKWCKENNFYSRLVFDKDIPRILIKEARKWHKENNGKNFSKNISFI